MQIPCPTVEWVNATVQIPLPDVEWMDVTADGISMPKIDTGVVEADLEWTWSHILDLPTSSSKSFDSNVYESVHHITCNLLMAFHTMSNSAKNWILCNLQRNPSYGSFCNTAYLFNSGNKLDRLEEYVNRLDINSEIQKQLLLEFFLISFVGFLLMLMVWCIYQYLGTNGKNARCKKLLSQNTPAGGEEDNRIKIEIFIDPAKINSNNIGSNGKNVQCKNLLSQNTPAGEEEENIGTNGKNTPVGGED